MKLFNINSSHILLLLFLISLLNLLLIFSSSKTCESILPNNVIDCHDLHTPSAFCCFFETKNSPVSYKKCTQLNLDQLQTNLVIGNIEYKIDCGNSKLFRDSFPFYEYETCSVINPDKPTDCFKQNKIIYNNTLGNTQVKVNCCYGTSNVNSKSYCVNKPTHTSVIESANYTLTEQSTISSKIALNFECWSMSFKGISVVCIGLFLVLI